MASRSARGRWSPRRPGAPRSARWAARRRRCAAPRRRWRGAGPVVERRHLLAHQLVDARLPRRGRLGLRGEPDVRAAAAQPEVEVERRVEVGGEEAEVDRLVVAALEPVDERCPTRAARRRCGGRPRAQSSRMTAAPRSSAVLPFCVISVSRAGSPDASSSVPSPLRSEQPEARQQSPGLVGAAFAARQVGHVPTLVGGGHRPVHRHGRAEEHRVGERLAVDGARDGAPQLRAADPRPPRVGRLRCRVPG